MKTLRPDVVARARSGYESRLIDARESYIRRMRSAQAEAAHKGVQGGPMPGLFLSMATSEVRFRCDIAVEELKRAASSSGVAGSSRLESDLVAAFDDITRGQAYPDVWEWYRLLATPHIFGKWDASPLEQKASENARLAAVTELGHFAAERATEKRKWLADLAWRGASFGLGVIFTVAVEALKAKLLPGDH